jgi:hypothetical protein
MLEWNPLTLVDRNRIEARLFELNIQLSNINYTNFMMWSHKREYQFAWHQEALFLRVRVQGKDWEYFFPMPPLLGEDCMGFLVSSVKEMSTELAFRTLDLDQVSQVRNFFSQEVRVESLENQFDYVYLTQDLVNLSGSRFHSKRNFVNQFEARYNHQYFTISNDNIEDIRIACHNWLYRDGEPDKQLVDEWIGINYLLDNIDNLSFVGAVIYVENKVVAFTLGELLNLNTVVIHVEKADQTYRGSYPMIANAYLKQCWPQTTFVNREEDLGIEGLRKSKKSYQPKLMVEKYCVSVQL